MFHSHWEFKVVILCREILLNCTPCYYRFTNQNIHLCVVDRYVSVKINFYSVQTCVLIKCKGWQLLNVWSVQIYPRCPKVFFEKYHILHICLVPVSLPKYKRIWWAYMSKDLNAIMQKMLPKEILELNKNYNTKKKEKLRPNLRAWKLMKNSFSSDLIFSRFFVED